MFLFKGKKGVELSLLALVQLILIIAFVFFPLWEFVLSDHYKLFERRFISKDISLIIDTIYAAPGEVYYTYDQKGTESLGYNFSKNTACVFYEFVDIFNYPKSCYNFFEDSKINFIYSQLSIKDYYRDLSEKELRNTKLKPSFIKKADEISVSVGAIIPDKEHSLIPVTSGYDFKKTLVAYDPKKDSDEILSHTALKLSTYFTLDAIERDASQTIASLSKNDIISKNPDLLVILDISKNEKHKKTIEIQRSLEKKEEYRLADLAFSQQLTRRLKSNLDIGQIDIQLAEVHDSLLQGTNVSLRIILGNPDDDTTKEFLLGKQDNIPNLDLIAKSVYEAALELKQNLN